MNQNHQNSHYCTVSGKGDTDCPSSDCVDYLEWLIGYLQCGAPLSMTIEEALRSLRVVIRTKDHAESAQ